MAVVYGARPCIACCVALLCILALLLPCFALFAHLSPCPTFSALFLLEAAAAGFLYFRLQEGCLADGTGGVTAVVFGTLLCGCGLWYPAMICVSFATGPR
jgi:hypothetical protein